MASISTDKSGNRRILYFDENRKRRVLYSKNDSIWGARREIQRRRRHAPSQHGRYRTPKQLARNAKNPGKTFGFAAERTGTELLGVFPLVLVSSRGAAFDG